MKRLAAGTPLLLIVVALLGCAKTSSVSEEIPPAPHIMALVVEKVVEGEVLGETLSHPTDLEVDRRGNVYLVDAGNHRIVRFDSSLTPRDEVGGFGRAAEMFDTPSHIAIDNELNLWVTDMGNSRLCRLDSRLQYVSEIELIDEDDALMYRAPSGVAVSSVGEVWMCDRDANRVAVFDVVGNLDQFVGDFGHSGGQLLHPEDVLMWDRDRFLVCDAGNSRLVWYDQYGNYLSQLYDKEFGSPVAASIDSYARLWVVDYRSGVLTVLDSDNAILGSWGPSLSGTPTNLREPTAMAFLSRDSFILADAGNNRLLKCRLISETP